MRLVVIRILSSLVLLFAASGSLAVAAEPAKTFNIPAGPAESALKAFVTQSGQEVLFATATVGRVQTNAVRGSLAPSAALDQLLQGTGLVATRDNPNGTISITRGPDVPNALRAAPAPNGDRPNSGPVTLASKDLVEMSPFLVDT